MRHLYQDGRSQPPPTSLLTSRNIPVYPSLLHIITEALRVKESKEYRREEDTPSPPYDEEGYIPVVLPTETGKRTLYALAYRCPLAALAGEIHGEIEVVILVARLR